MGGKRVHSLCLAINVHGNARNLGVKLAARPIWASFVLATMHIVHVLVPLRLEVVHRVVVVVNHAIHLNSAGLIVQGELSGKQLDVTVAAITNYGPCELA